jgi:hypothetical protein
MLKIPFHCSFKPNLHELWSKEGVGLKLGIWFPTTNPLKEGVKWGLIGACYTPLEIYFQGSKKFPCTFKTNLIWERYEGPKFWDNKSFDFGTPTWDSRGKVMFGCSPCREASNIIEGGEWCLFPKVIGCVKLVLEVVITKFVTPFPFDLHQPPFFLLVVHVDFILNFFLWVHLSPIVELQHTLLPLKCCELRSMPQFFFFYCFILKPAFGSFQEFGGVSNDLRHKNLID